MGYSSLSSQYAKAASMWFSGKQRGTAKEGYRQEKWQEIMKVGDTSDTDWESKISKGLKSIKRTYESMGEWASQKVWHKSDRDLWEATHGSRGLSQVGTVIKSKTTIGGGLKTPVVPKGYTKNWAKRTGTGRDQGVRTLSAQERHAYKTYEKELSAIQRQRKAAAIAQQKTSMAKWMAAYNKQVNLVERTAASKRRMSYRKRFQEMQIRQEQSQTKSVREATRRGVQGLLVNLTGAGLGLPQ